jgi:hypothetical protein
MPESLQGWLQALDEFEVDETDVDQARRAVRKVLANPEVQEHWSDSRHAADWKENVKYLLERLS